MQVSRKRTQELVGMLAWFAVAQPKQRSTSSDFGKRSVCPKSDLQVGDVGEYQLKYR